MDDFKNTCSNFYNNYCEPLLFRNFRGPPFWPVIVVSIVLFLLSTEIGSQDCVDGNCNHYNDYTKSINKKDKPSKSIDKIINMIRLNHTLVNWRRAMIVAIFLSTIITFFVYSGLPPGIDFLIVATVIFTFLYLSDAWVQIHWWNFNDTKVEDKLLELRNHLKQDEIKNPVSYISHVEDISSMHEFEEDSFLSDLLFY